MKIIKAPLVPFLFPENNVIKCLLSTFPPLIFSAHAFFSMIFTIYTN